MQLKVWLEVLNLLFILATLGVLELHLLTAPRPKAQQPAGHQPRNQPSDSTR